MDRKFSFDIEIISDGSQNTDDPLPPMIETFTIEIGKYITYIDDEGNVVVVPDNSQDSSKDSGNFIPGFEAAAILMSILFVMVINKRRLIYK